MTPGADVFVNDAFVAKFDQDGELLWFHQFPYLGGRSVAFDAAGNLWWLAFLSGGDGDTIDLDPGAGEALIDGVVNSPNTSRQVLVQFDPDGNFLMATIWDASTTVQQSNLVFDPDGNPVVTSLLSTTSSTFTVSRRIAGQTDPADAEESRPTAGLGSPTFLSTWIEIDKGDGTVSFVDTFERVGLNERPFADVMIESITFGPNGEMFLSGGFYGEIDFDPDPSATTTATAAGGGNPFVVRLDETGAFDWVVSLGSDPVEYGTAGLRGLGVDDDGNVYAVGFHQFDLTAGSETISVDDGTGLVGSWQSDGTLRWIHPYRGQQGVEIGAAGPDGVYGSAIQTSGSGSCTERFMFDTDGTLRWAIRHVTGAVDRPWDLHTIPGGVLASGDGFIGTGSLTCNTGNGVAIGPYVFKIDTFGGTGSAEELVIRAETLTEIAAGYDNWVIVPLDSCAVGSVFRVTSGTLPAGLVLDPSTGIITGTPTSTGPYDFTITVENRLGPVSQQFTGSVTNGSVPTWPSDHTADRVGDIVERAPVSVTFAALGGPAPTYTVTAGELPSGLTLDERTGELTGTVFGGTGTYSFTITATNPLGSAALEVTGSYVPAEAPAWSPDPALGRLEVGVPVSVSLAVSSGRPAPTYFIRSGALPAGLELDPSTGLVTGTPTEAGPYEFELGAFNNAGPAFVTLSGEVLTAGGGGGGGGGDVGGGDDDGGGSGGDDGDGDGDGSGDDTSDAPETAPSWSQSPTLGAMRVGAPFTGSLAVSSGNPAPTYSIRSGSLPAGLILDLTTGAVLGTPTESGEYEFVVVATNSVESTEVTVSGVVLPGADGDSPSPILPATGGTVALVLAAGAALLVLGRGTVRMSRR